MNLNHFSRILFAVLLLACLPALATEPDQAFQAEAAKYRAAKRKPELPETAHKYKVQAEFAVQEKRPEQAIELYGKALEIVPWWPEGHYNLAMLLADKKQYKDAMREMQRYLMLVPKGPNARLAQDKIYQWEIVPELVAAASVPVAASAVAVAAPVAVAGKTFRDCPECPEMVELPAGSFTMGSNMGEPDAQPLHAVNIAKPFAIGKTEVTQAQWRAVMKTDPSYFETCDDTCPVEQVSWNDAQEFIKKLNAQTGKRYRLPTEAEWEYACRGGGQQEYCGSDIADQVGWTSYNSGSFLTNKPHPVATRRPNAFGLYDMSGNVWEWVEDIYHENYNGAPTDGSAWTTDSGNSVFLGGNMRVLRGGSWGNEMRSSSAAARMKFGPDIRNWSYGFRLARDLP
jgi:formylglycine-generating enzyme required for sulfatase activity